MMAAHRLKGLGWFASCAGIVLAFYLVSLQVAQERDKLDALNARIRTAQRDVRALETEFDTRANLQQLEKWNGDILALSAPVAGQFVTGGAQLASVRFDRPAPMEGEGEVRTAALVVPALPVAAPAPIEVRTASVQKAATAARASAATPAATAEAAVTPATRPVAPEMQRVAMIDGGLLSDLKTAARAEASRR